MNDIKFRYVIQDNFTGDIFFDYFSLKKIESGKIKEFIDNSNFSIISRDLYTGENDKNAKEIYEGDIAKKIEEVESGVHWLNTGDTELVEISPYGVSPCAVYDDDCGTREKGENWEIIGNIHEKPEPVK